MKKNHPFDFHHRDFHDWYFFVNKNLFQKNAKTIWSNFFLNMIYKTKNYIIEKQIFNQVAFLSFRQKKEERTKWISRRKKNKMAPSRKEKLKFLLVSKCLCSIPGTTTSMQPPESANEPMFYKNNVCDSVVKEKRIIDYIYFTP